MSVPSGFRGSWLSKLSHDLRNQLSPMRTATQLLQSGRLDAERQAEMLGMIERQVQRMVRMLDDVAEYGRLGGPGGKREALDLGIVIDTAVGDSGPKLRAAGQVLDQHMPDARLPLHGERARLVHLFSRLIDNAVRFSPPGGRILLRVTVDDGVAEVVLRDSGPGIDPARFDDIFTLPDGPRASEGLGLSLLLARATAEAHGGTLDVRARPSGDGAEFVVRLPLLADQPSSSVQRS